MSTLKKNVPMNVSIYEAYMSGKRPQAKLLNMLIESINKELANVYETNTTKIANHSQEATVGNRIR